MTRHGVISIALVACLTAIAAAESAAQPLGTFRWQLLPYCNVVVASITAQGQIFSLAGFDDQCGAGQRASASGTAFQNPDGTIGIGLNIVVAPGGGHVHVDARISLASLGGPWSDSAGNSGSFVFTPAGNLGGPPRPAPSHSITRVFEASQITWDLKVYEGFNFREAVLSVPEITAAVVDRAGVAVFVGELPYGEPWTAMPLTLVDAVKTYALMYSVAPGKVVVRISSMGNVDPGTNGLSFKVVITR